MFRYLLFGEKKIIFWSPPGVAIHYFLSFESDLSTDGGRANSMERNNQSPRYI